LGNLLITNGLGI